MTTQCVVRAALTEECSKAEINSSALRCRDEKSPFTRTIRSLENTTFLRLLCFVNKT